MSDGISINRTDFLIRRNGQVIGRCVPYLHFMEPARDPPRIDYPEDEELVPCTLYRVVDCTGKNYGVANWGHWLTDPRVIATKIPDYNAQIDANGQFLTRLLQKRDIAAFEVRCGRDALRKAVQSARDNGVVEWATPAVVAAWHSYVRATQERARWTREAEAQAAADDAALGHCRAVGDLMSVAFGLGAAI